MILVILEVQYIPISRSLWCFSAHSLEKVDCLQDRKRVDCLKDQDEDTFFDVMDFMRYFKRDPEALKKEGKLALGQEGIPGFK